MSDRITLSATFWVRVAVVLPAALLLHYALDGWLNLRDDTGNVAAFVTAVGTLYSVLTAFTVISVWTEFIETDRVVQREARELGELWRYVGYVSDQEGARKARVTIERYRDEVVATEWPAMAVGRTAPWAEDQFIDMVDAVNAIDVVTAKDVPAWTEATRTLGALSESRGSRVVLLTLRMPRVLRLLLYLANASLVGGMLLLGFDSDLVAGLLVGCTVVVSLLVLEVIDDIDNPFGGAWGVSPEPFREALARHPVG